MDDAAVIDIAVQAMLVAAKLSAPMLLVALCIGFIVSLFQSVTQIQEPTLSFVPKALGVAVVLVLSGSWMLAEMTEFTTGLFDRIPDLLAMG
ncbi:flagellar biosynthesis protein FliQ [Quadrisphaera sp. INWT6]|jgi:flagellar biosynthetic protein FliQ|uniref:flagellar biosynthesis protein FliQ n=1 Tax=Quadrisphaera sp. INWT6 TaxID=2596917 RepID=UPI00189247AB|nr:flagellar biosynthesis protein FliQ [Quadrisphaera sp. INWT6]MBF5083112.1 flagellar biosynthesis protein FliQ [Quadrisphaera sp. INWT6]